MRIQVLALALSGLAAGAVNAKEPKLPVRFEFNMARSEHVDYDPATGFSRANCRKFRDYRPRRMKDGTAKIFYREYDSKGRWKPKQAILKHDGKEWVWKDGDEPRCTLYILG